MSSTKNIHNCVLCCHTQQVSSHFLIASSRSPTRFLRFPCLSAFLLFFEFMFPQESQLTGNVLRHLANVLPRLISPSYEQTFVRYNVKGILHSKIKILSSFTHTQVVANLYEFLSSAEHKGRYFEKRLEPNSCLAPLTSIVENHGAKDPIVLQNIFLCVHCSAEERNSYSFCNNLRVSK